MIFMLNVNQSNKIGTKKSRDNTRKKVHESKTNDATRQGASNPLMCSPIIFLSLNVLYEMELVNNTCVVFILIFQA